MDSSKIIRKLGVLESIYDFEVSNKNFLLTRVVLATLNPSFTIDLDSIQSAIKIWTNLHPLLQSFIVTSSNQSNFDPDSTRYFVYMNKTLENYNNFELIETDEKLKWASIVEDELKTQFDLENGPLWRIKIVKINGNVENNYAFVFTTHHGLGDGRNAYSILLQFINILASLISNTKWNESEIEVSQPPVEELVEIERSKAGFKAFSEDIGYDSVTNRMPKKLGDFNEGTCSKFDYLFVDKARFEALIKKMKLNAPDCKLTSLFGAILCLAFKRVFEKYKVSDVETSRFQYYTMIR